MAKNVKKFVNREFAKTVDLDLLKRLLAPYASAIAFSWDALSTDEKERREEIFEFFRGTDERFPAELLDALHKIMVLSDVNGARLLHEQAELAGIELIPQVEINDDNAGRHLTPRHLALRAYLQHRTVFEKALDIHAFWSVRSPSEFAGAREGVESNHDKENARTAFKDAASAYFANRYLGRYCDVRWYSEDDEIYILVLHGKNAMTANVEDNGAERTLTYREIAQDTIRYHPISGRVKISASSAVERKKLLRLFAEHMIGHPDFFEGHDSQRLYTLDPIRRQGGNFRFQHAWDPQLSSVAIKEIQIDEGEHEIDGKTRYSPWAMTVRDSRDAIHRLRDLAPDVDFQDLRITYVKLDFRFDVDGKNSPVIVKLKPPNVASFRDHSFEEQIMEHLERNGLRLARRSIPTAVAAE
jgi:hypothetical protein